MRAFAEIAFTPSVKEAQSRYGTRQANSGFETAPDRRDEITSRESAFIEARDSFYIASHGTEGDGHPGWPYVQHRGGWPGFLQVIDAKTLAFADYRGNRQYLTTGNVAADDRVSLFLMDYPNRTRLKIWARAHVLHYADDPALFQRLANPSYKARVERAFVLKVEALDWNCPQHITPRYSETELDGRMRLLNLQNLELKARIAELERLVATPPP